MKKFNPSAMCRKTLFSLLLLIISLLAFSFTSAANTLRDDKYLIVKPKIIIQGKHGIQEWQVELKVSECNGKFITLEDGLEDISGFCFKFGIEQLVYSPDKANIAVCDAIKNSQAREFSFTQTKLMMLPIMKVVHLIGDMKTVTGSYSNAIQLQYKYESDGQIKFSGKQVVFLSGFGIKNEQIVAGSEQDQISIVIEFTLAKKQLNSMK